MAVDRVNTDPFQIVINKDRIKGKNRGINAKSYVQLCELTAKN